MSRIPPEVIVVDNCLSYGNGNLARVLYKRLAKFKARFGHLRVLGQPSQRVCKRVSPIGKIGERYNALDKADRAVKNALAESEVELYHVVREELLVRNVARLVELPASRRSEITPWTTAEVRQFLEAARPHPQYPAFLMLLLYGLRRGEVLGLRWSDVEFDKGTLHVRQQLQRLSSGLCIGPVKTQAGQRDLPLLNMVRKVLMAEQFEQAVRRSTKVGANDGAPADRLVFTTPSGHPVEPKNLVRSFHQICQVNGIRRIKLHHLRHTTATLLKDLGVPVRDAQLILGHSQISVTQEIYQHDSLETRRKSLEQVEALFLRRININSGRCRQELPSTPAFQAEITGGPGYTFLKPSEADELIADLILLHSRLVELGMEYRNGEVYLADLEVRDV